MLVRQHSSEAGLYSTLKSHRKRSLPLLHGSSPLLLMSKPEVTRDRLCNGADKEDSATRGNDCSQVDPLQIKELCQSPRASRHSMFRFSPTPMSSPEFDHKDFGDLSHLKDHSQIGDLSHLKDHSQIGDLSHQGDLSDDSPLSSPESTRLVSSNESPVSIDRRRYFIINEIISTEAKYIDNLNTILSVFMPAFEHVVSPRALRLLIPAQLEMLVESHEEILSSLKKRMNSETKFYGFIGDIFSRLCGRSNVEFFNIYRVYMGEFKLAMKIMEAQEKESAQFKEILSLLQQCPLCERLNLASYLLTPIQRLPRYELLLKELLKHTPSEHPDHYYIGEALNRLRRELTKLNLSIRSCQMACPASKKRRESVRRKPSRTLSMLKKFMSATNIDDYSSGDNSFTTNGLKPPSLRIPRRLKTIKSSSSFCGSDINISASLNSETSQMMFRRQTLTPNRAVSCSDLLEFNSQQQPQMKFRLLTPLASEESSLHSSVDSQRHSYLYSSNSSLSSDDSKKDEDLREGSLTPTQTITSCSTPLTSKDSTLKVTGNIKFLVEDDDKEEEEEEEGEVVSAADVSTNSKHSRKNIWRLSLFKKRKNSNKSELKYIKQ